jgi:hypothetical protein
MAQHVNQNVTIKMRSQDFTKWKLVDTVGIRFVLFNAHRYHMSMEYFGDTKENGKRFSFLLKRTNE